MQAQNLYVADHQTRALNGWRELRHGRNMAARKDVALNPRIIEIRHIAVADEVQQHDAIIAKQFVALAEKGVVEPGPYMLEHAHRNNAVERTMFFAIHVAVILQPVLQFLGVSGLRCLVLGTRKLLGG